MANKNIRNQCGACCKLFLINLNEKEYKSNKFKTIFDEIATLDNFSDTEECGANFVAKKEDGSCFYLENNICSIHKKRPEVCKGFFCTADNIEHAKMREIVFSEIN